MTAQQRSASTIDSASKVLPATNVISLPTAKPKRVQLHSFTKASVGKMICPTGKAEELFWDGSCGGFGLRALASGRRTWIYQYRNEYGQTRRMVLGDVSAVPLEDATSSSPTGCQSYSRRGPFSGTQGAAGCGERAHAHRGVPATRSGPTTTAILRRNGAPPPQARRPPSSQTG